MKAKILAIGLVIFAWSCDVSQEEVAGEVRGQISFSDTDPCVDCEYKVIKLYRFMMGRTEPLPEKNEDESRDDYRERVSGYIDQLNSKSTNFQYTLEGEMFDKKDYFCLAVRVCKRKNKSKKQANHTITIIRLKNCDGNHPIYPSIPQDLTGGSQYPGGEPGSDRSSGVGRDDEESNYIDFEVEDNKLTELSLDALGAGDDEGYYQYKDDDPETPAYAGETTKHKAKTFFGCSESGGSPDPTSTPTNRPQEK